MLDIKIIGGEVFDGAGAPAVNADVGIVGDRIDAIGDLSRAEARATVDARGKIVCPGFVDVHSHSDAYLLIEPAAPSKIHQGITTEVVGNCGASAAPRLGVNALPSDWREHSYPGRWSSVAEYRGLLAQVKPAPNVVLLIGHNTLRRGLVGHENRPASAAELRQMQLCLERSLEEGGRGFSTGLIYPPGMFAPTEEIVALAAVAAKRGGIYATHMRSEGERLLEALGEAIAIGRAAGIRVQVSHLKTSGRSAWGLLDGAFALIEEAQAAGVDVMADRYPYTSSCTDLDVIFPPWAQEGGPERLLRRLADPAERRRLQDELVRSRAEDYWSTVVIGSTQHPDNRRFRGQPLVEAARALGMSPAEAALHIVELDGLKTSAFFFGMSEPNMFRILGKPYVMLGSDASLRSLTGPLSQDYPHPRAFGSFPRFLRMALDGKTVSTAEAVRKMSALPAARFGLPDRGILAAGKKADVLVVDPARIRDMAEYGAPHRLAEGVDTVIVNGVLTLSGGRPTGARGGRFL